MKTIGSLIKNARELKNSSHIDIENVTKIKSAFIKSIEEEDWGNLPDFAVVTGFIKKISEVLGMDVNQTIAIFRRDYPPRAIELNPKPDLKRRFLWSPKLTFFLGLFVCLFGVSIYLGFQYKNFINPPRLSIDTPIDGQIVNERKIMVKGLTDDSATVTVNSQPVLVSSDGSFVTELEIFEGTSDIVIKSVSRTGKETVINRKINVQID